MTRPVRRREVPKDAVVDRRLANLERRTGRPAVVAQRDDGFPCLVVDPNVLAGCFAGASLPLTAVDHVFIGKYAGYAMAADLAGSFPGMVAVGAEALGNYVNTQEWRSTMAVGGYALQSITEGDANTAFGYRAGADIGSAGAVDGNTLVGAESGGGTRLNDFNTAVGVSALRTAGSGSAIVDSCVAVGAAALGGNVLTGNENVGVGRSALQSLTSGVENVAVGHRAGFNTIAITAGSRNTVLGSRATAAKALATVNDGVAVGRSALVTDTGGVAVGSAAGTTGVGGVAVGQGASAGDVAIGAGAASTGGIAIGAGVAAAANLAVLGGAAHALKVGDPGGGQGAWKLGKYLTGAVALDAAHYVEVLIDGTVRKLLVAA